MADFEQPGKRTTYQGDQRRSEAQQEKLRRNRTRAPKVIGLAKLGSEPAESWKPGTIWLKTLDEPEA